MPESNEEKKENFLTRTLKSVYHTDDIRASGKGLSEPTASASYKSPISSQIGQIDRGEAWWRDFAWEEYATKDLPGLGLGFTVYPYVAVWEKIWGAVPTEDYNKYKQYYSVHKDRVVPLKFSDDAIKFFTLEEVWILLSKLYKPITDGFEETIYVPTEAQLQTLSYNFNIKEGEWKSLQLITRHKFSGKLVRLQQRNGETIVTDNHSVYDEKGNLVKPETNPTLAKVTSISNGSIQIKDSLTLSFSVEPVLGKIHSMPNGGVVQASYKKKYLVTRTLSGEPLKNFARFLGAYTAEGWIKHHPKKGNKPYAVYITNTDEAWIMNVQTWLSSFIDTNGLITVRKNSSGSTQYTLEVVSQDLATIVEYYCGKKSHEKEIPSFLFFMPTNIKKAFLSEYTFGDGEQWLRAKGTWSGTTVSPKLIGGLSLLFAQMNVTSNISVNTVKDAYFIYEVKYHLKTESKGKLNYIPYDDYVYDLGVADFHNFVDGCGLVVTHNTQEPFIRATIDFHTQMTISQGYELDYPLDTVVKDVKAFLDRHDFINLLKIMVKDMLVFGNSYTEVVRTWFCHNTGHDLASLRISYETTSQDGSTRYWWTDRLDVAAKHNQMYPTHKLENPYGEITRFKPLDPMYMRVRRDAYGTILGYVQYYVFPLVTFLADEMIHLRYMPTSWTYESVYGVSMLRPILFHQELMKNYEQTMGAIMNVFLKPMFLVHVGGPNDALGGADVTSQQFNQVKRFFQSSQPGQSIVIRASSPVEVTPIDPPIDRMQTTAFWLQWLHNMRTYALSVPKFFTDPAGLNRATAQTVEKGYFTFINSNRQSLNSQLEDSIMKMVLKSLYGKIADELIHEYGVPKFIWKPVKEDSLEDKAKTYLPLYASRILTKNEVRKALGFEPLDEEELVEEVGESNPPLGQTGMSGVGAPGVTREGTPTFGSPDDKMASRPPTGAQQGVDEYPSTGETGDEFTRQEQEQDMDDLADELDELKREFQKKLQEAEMEQNDREKRGRLK